MNSYNDYMKSRAGFSLIELLLVSVILIILFIISMVAWRNSINKANDARRKDDLQRLSVAFEEYFSDKECYPAEDILQTCGGNSLSPYLSDVPCDPVFDIPYCYVTDTDNPSCFKNFRLLAPLKNAYDPVISKLDCHGEGVYCGWESQCALPERQIEGFNYGVTSGGIPLLNPSAPQPSPSAAASALPQPSSGPGSLACDPTGQCNEYENPQGAGCPLTFASPTECQQYCDESSSYWCEQ